MIFFHCTLTEDIEYDHIWASTDEDEWVEEDDPTSGLFCCMSINLVHLACDYDFFRLLLTADDNFLWVREILLRVFGLC